MFNIFYIIRALYNLRSASPGISQLFGTRANILSALLRRAKAFKHGKTQCTNIGFIICFARLKKYGTVQVL